MNSTRITRWFVYILIGFAVIAILWNYNLATPTIQSISISQLAQEIRQNEVRELQVSGDGREVLATYVNPNRASTQTLVSGVSSIEEILRTYGVTEADYVDGQPVVTYTPPSQ